MVPVDVSGSSGSVDEVLAGAVVPAAEEDEERRRLGLGRPPSRLAEEEDEGPTVRSSWDQIGAVDRGQRPRL